VYVGERVKITCVWYKNASNSPQPRQTFKQSVPSTNASQTFSQIRLSIYNI